MVRAKVPAPNNRKSSRVANCMKKCNKCVACPFIKECKYLKRSFGVFNVKINKPVNYNTSNVVYIIECSKCTLQYVGETGREFKMRLKEHLGYVRNSKLNEPTGETGLHFNLPGHNISMLKASILEKCFHSSTTYRKQRGVFYSSLSNKVQGHE